jgi:RNA polymerase sigma factor (sigma-70 family)
MLSRGGAHRDDCAGKVHGNGRRERKPLRGGILCAGHVIRLVLASARSSIESTVNQDDAPDRDDERPVALARRAAAGDTAATAELLRAVAPAMLRVVRGVMGTRSADADDALQQALIALIHALPAFRGECSPAGYACRIAFRVALALRKRTRRVDRERERWAASEETNTDADPPSQTFEASRRMALLRQLLDEIPPEQAEALAMRTILGWSREEIARTSGVPVNTVRSRMRLAKEALRSKIEADPALAEELGVWS